MRTSKPAKSPDPTGRPCAEAEREWNQLFHELDPEAKGLPAPEFGKGPLDGIDGPHAMIGWSIFCYRDLDLLYDRYLCEPSVEHWVCISNPEQRQGMMNPELYRRQGIDALICLREVSAIVSIASDKSKDVCAVRRGL